MRAVAGCAVFTALFASGCRTIDGTYGLPPFWETYPSASTNVREPGGSETLVRPFWSHERTLESSRWSSFPPFVEATRTGLDDISFRVLPILFHRRVRQPEGLDVDWMVFPIAFWGRDAAAGPYAAVFPLGGVLKGVFGQKRTVFALFPLVWYWENDQRNSLHVLFPFYNRVWGPHRSGSRLWPFYARYDATNESGEPRYERTAILWPFYIRGKNLLDTRPTDTFFSFPFYGYSRSERRETETYLWPFFQTTLDRKTGERSYGGYLFPYRVNQEQTDIWPLFGVKRETEPVGTRGVVRRRYRQFALWPIQRYDWNTNGAEETTHFWFMPLYWHFHRVDSETFETTSEWQLWPFVAYRRRGHEVELDFLAPLWTRKESYRRYYSRWFELFRYRNRSDLSGWELLYGAVSYRSDRAAKERLFTVLGGLFECGYRADAFSVRLLYIPWW